MTHMSEVENQPTNQTDRQTDRQTDNVKYSRTGRMGFNQMLADFCQAHIMLFQCNVTSSVCRPRCIFRAKNCTA
jgi:hypothetical protein